MQNIKVLHVDDSEFDRHVVDCLLDGAPINMIGVNSLQDFQLKLDANHEFVIAIIDGSFPDESHGVPRLNIARAYDIAQIAGVQILYILSGEALDRINQELGSERKPEGIYKKGTQSSEFKIAIKQKIDELNK